jgi:hypothetical protein
MTCVWLVGFMRESLTRVCTSTRGTAPRGRLGRRSTQNKHPRRDPGLGVTWRGTPAAAKHSALVPTAVTQTHSGATVLPSLLCKMTARYVFGRVLPGNPMTRSTTQPTPPLLYKPRITQTPVLPSWSSASYPSCRSSPPFCPCAPCPSAPRSAPLLNTPSAAVLAQVLHKGH